MGVNVGVGVVGCKFVCEKKRERGNETNTFLLTPAINMDGFRDNKFLSFPFGLIIKKPNKYCTQNSKIALRFLVQNLPR